MNERTCLLALGAALLLAPLTSTLAQSWETVDELAPWRGRDIVADSAGNFFSLAIDNSTSSTGPVYTAVNLSSNGGATWESVGLIGGYAVDLTVAPDGTLFASGNRSTTVSGRAFVWRSNDQGTTWTVSDPWAGPSTKLLCQDVAAGNSGAIYLCGTVTGTAGWIVRKGQVAANGIAWSTANTFSATGATAHTVYVAPGSASQSDDVLVCGLANGLWTVRRSINGGATWTTIDSYRFASKSGYMNSAYAITSGADGSVYVVGRVSQPVGKTTEYGWLVRKSSNGGATWSNVDYVAKAWPQCSITVDAFGRIFAAGFNQTTPYMWFVRASTDGGATWVTTDSFAGPGNTTSQAWAVASDAAGNVCVTGETGTAGNYAAPIRRLAAP